MSHNVSPKAGARHLAPANATAGGRVETVDMWGIGRPLAKRHAAQPRRDGGEEGRSGKSYVRLG